MSAKCYFRSAVTAMSGYVPGEQPMGGPFIKLNQNENPYPPSPRVREAVMVACGDLPTYPEPSNRVIREAAAAIYDVQPEQVMAVNGSDEILRILCQCCVGEGDVVYSFQPSFTYYRMLAEVQGAAYRTIELTDAMQVPSELPDLLRSDGKILFVPNPGAPSGVLLPERDIRRLCEAMPHALVVVDEAYADFAGVTALPLLREYPNLVITRTLSKSYSLAGLRVGLGIASREVIAELDKVRDIYNLDHLTQAGAAAALGDTAYLAEVVAKINQTRERLVVALREMGVRVWPAAGNFILAQFAAPGMISARELLGELRARKILVRYFDTPRLTDCLRISIGTDEEIDTLLAALRETINVSA